MKKHFANFTRDLKEMDRPEPEIQTEKGKIPVEEPAVPKQEDQHPEQAVADKKESDAAAAIPQQEDFLNISHENMLMAVMLRELLNKPVALRDENKK